MSAPNRAQEIVNIFSSKNLQFITNDEERFEKNLKVIVAELNKIDGGKWGFLKKNDQGGKIPTDIICWKDTMEIFDVLLGTTGGPSWDAKGIVDNPNWVWEPYVPPTPKPNPNPEPEPGPIPIPIPIGELFGPLIDKLDEVRISVDALTNQVSELNKNGIKTRLVFR